MKLLFNDQSDKYKKYRPDYPPELLAHFIPLLKERKLAWDAGCGNGQLALLLKPHFEYVIGTDPSESQLAEAPQKEGIIWKQERAENSSLEKASCDLVTTSQALHWLKHDAFFEEVNRVLKPGGLFMALGYGFNKIGVCLEPNEEDNERVFLLNQVMSHFYNSIVGSFWEPERKYIDNCYSDIHFPFEALPFVPGEMIKEWKLIDYLGYVGTWSAVKTYQKQFNENPLEALAVQLRSYWQAGKVRKIHFPLFGYLGRK